MEMNTLARKVVWSVGTQASRAKTNETIEEQTHVAHASEPWTRWTCRCPREGAILWRFHMAAESNEFNAKVNAITKLRVRLGSGQRPFAK